MPVTSLFGFGVQIGCVLDNGNGFPALLSLKSGFFVGAAIVALVAMLTVGTGTMLYRVKRPVTLTVPMGSDGLVE